MGSAVFFLLISKEVFIFSGFLVTNSANTGLSGKKYLVLLIVLAQLIKHFIGGQDRWERVTHSRFNTHQKRRRWETCPQVGRPQATFGNSQSFQAWLNLQDSINIHKLQGTKSNGVYSVVLY